MTPFGYTQPKNLKEVQSVLAKNKNSLLFAGGTDVLGLIKDDIIAPSELVNLKKTGLNSVIVTSSELKIGPLATITEIAENDLILEKISLLAEAAREVASPQLRNVGTLGGNICQRPRCWYFRGEFNCLRKGGDTCFAYQGQNKYHCVTGGSPCFIVHPSDTAVALTALGAKLVIYSKGKTKTVAMKDFFVGPSVDYTKENILQHGDILQEIIVPLPQTGTKSRFIKFKERDVWDFAVVSIAAVIEKHDGRISKVNIAFGGLAPVPLVDQTLNKALLNADVNSLEGIISKFLIDAEPLSMNKFKIPLTRNLLKRTLSELLSI